MSGIAEESDEVFLHRVDSERTDLGYIFPMQLGFTDASLEFEPDAFEEMAKVEIEAAGRELLEVVLRLYSLRSPRPSK